MDNKDEKKKESIDDILSDLNGLLNKMPSILDGIKMPDMKPVEFHKPAAGPEPESAAAEPSPEKKAEVKTPAEPPRFDAEKTVVINSLSGLPEGAFVPEDKSSGDPASPDGGFSAPFTAPPAFDGDKTVVISSLSGLPEGASAPGAEPGDMLSREPAGFEPRESAPLQAGGPVKLAGSILEPPAAKSKTGNRNAPSLSISDLNPPPSRESAGGSEAAGLENPDRKEDVAFARFEELSGKKSVSEEGFPVLPVANLACGGGSEAVGDFSVPDIDALMQLSEGSPAAEGDRFAGDSSEASPAPAPAPFSPAPEGEPSPSTDDLAEFEKQLAAAAPQEMNMSLDSASEEKFEQPVAAETAPEPFAQQPAQENPLPEAVPVSESDFGAAVVEPVAVEFPASSPAADETIKMEPVEKAAANNPEIESVPAAESAPIQPDQEAAPAPQPDFGMTLPGPQASEEPVPAPEGGIELAPAPEQQAAAPEQESYNPAVEPGLTVGSPSVAPVDAGDATIVMSAPPSGGADGDQTVVFQSSVGHGEASRAKLEDLDGLSRKEAPAGIAAERIRPLFFLYSPDSGVLCANVLAELDAICLRSQASPMFVKRAGVNVFDPGMNANFVMQTVSDSGAAGLVCVGGIPQEKIYEIENVFNSSGVYFRHLDSESFTHSAMLDLLLEVILR